MGARNRAGSYVLETPTVDLQKNNLFNEDGVDNCRQTKRGVNTSRRKFNGMGFSQVPTPLVESLQFSSEARKLMIRTKFFWIRQICGLSILLEKMSIWV